MIAPVRRALASRLALRLALVLVSVTAVGMLVMALYVSRAWERYATERLETVLTTSARVVHEVIAPPGVLVMPPSLLLRLKSGTASSVSVSVALLSAGVGSTPLEPSSAAVAVLLI